MTGPADDRTVPLIALTDARLDRGGAPVLGPLTLRANERRIGIVGRNGSGKSTLLRLLAGLSAASSGEVRIAGIEPAIDRGAALQTVGILFQNPDHQIIFPTVAEELAFGLEQIGTPRAEARRQVQDLLLRSGRANWADRQVQTLSEGQRRWLCLMAVVLMRPRILLLDEPFAGLDIPTTLALEDEFARLPQALVTVTHDPAHLAGYDRVVWIEDGNIAADGAPAVILPAYTARMQELGREGIC